MVYTRVYVAELKSPNHFYVGTTLRLPYMREKEHAEGWGAQFTKLHGFHRMLVMELVPVHMSGKLEDELTVELMCRYGWGNVRGGDRTATKECVLRRWLPQCLKTLDPTHVLPLHLRPMSQFPTQFARLVDRFEVVRGF